MTKSLLFLIYIFVFGVANNLSSPKSPKDIAPCGDGGASAYLKDADKSKEPLKILSMPLPSRSSGNGLVDLKVTFLADGKIGKITVISGLRNELIDEVIKSARAITFVPAKENGKPITVTQTVEYHFQGPTKCLQKPVLPLQLHP